MNASKWESLPADIKDAFRRASDEQFLKEIGQMWKDDEQRGIEVMQKFGKEHIVLTKAETDEFRSKLEPVVERWISDASKSGVDGKVLVFKARRLIAKHSQQLTDIAIHSLHLNDLCPLVFSLSQLEKACNPKSMDQTF